ncbi:pilus assembly protein [Halopseudomonas laoshanensis]|uniref:pilus assembly protein n=1 Tax=Halopseudomonas laoshanensis TaxID=2268758 RepID=UPI003735B497
MRTLELDFAPPRTASARGWVLLSLGLVSVLACGLAQQVISSQQAERAGAVVQVGAAELAADQQASTRSQSPEELRSSRAILAEIRSASDQVNRPWERLFVNLETLPLENVALLSLITDGRNRQLRIQAEARDLASMLAFHQELERSQELSDVYLINHQVMAQMDGEPVRFNLLVTWSGSHAPL